MNQTHEQQRNKHLARQARSDAIKELREGRDTWITVPDLDDQCLVRCRVSPIPEIMPYECGPKMLCLVERKLQAAIVVLKDGLRVFNAGYRIHDKHIYGWVREAHRITE